jgi:hypothetical protein
MEETNKFLSEKLFVILYYIISLILSYKATDYNSIYRAKHQKKTLEFVINIKNSKLSSPVISDLSLLKLLYFSLENSNRLET